MIAGRGFAFRPGTTEVTPGWLAINIPLSFIGAVLGGFVAALIDRSPRRTAAKALALLVVAMGLALALRTLRVGAPKPRKPTSQFSSFEAGAFAQQPTRKINSLDLTAREEKEPAVREVPARGRPRLRHLPQRPPSRARSHRLASLRITGGVSSTTRHFYLRRPSTK